MEIRSTFNLLFYIRKQRVNLNDEAPIYMRITVNKKSVALTTHRNIEVNQWDVANGMAIGNSKKAKEMNSYLFSLKASIYDHFKFIRETEKNVTPEAIKNAFLGIVPDKGRKVIELFQQHNNDIKKLSGIDYAPDTIQRYETSLRHTQEFIRYKYHLDDLYLVDLNMEFITAYEFFLKTERKIAHNSTMKYIKNFKKIVRIALLNGWIANDPFANYKMKLKKVDRGFLSDEELSTLINKKFQVKRLDEIRDCFVFSCFTGLAHSDLKRLTQANVVTGTDGGKWIKINRKKTDNLSSIPILGITQKLIEKYENNDYCVLNSVLLPVRTNQKMNAYLKEIQTICKFDKDLTTHLARHTFATTVTLNNDVPMESVSKMLGHSSMATTKIYARLLDKKVGKDMSKLDSIYC